MKAKNFYNIARHSGHTYNITSNPDPDYNLEFYKEIFWLMDQYSLQELTNFLDFLLKEGYCDSDVYGEPPTVIDQYLDPRLR